MKSYIERIKQLWLWLNNEYCCCCRAECTTSERGRKGNRTQKWKLKFQRMPFVRYRVSFQTYYIYWYFRRPCSEGLVAVSPTAAVRVSTKLDFLRFWMDEMSLAQVSLNTPVSLANFHSTDCVQSSFIMRIWYNKPINGQRVQGILPQVTNRYQDNVYANRYPSNSPIVCAVLEHTYKHKLCFFIYISGELLWLR
jgi:hypothetical protein